MAKEKKKYERKNRRELVYMPIATPGETIDFYLDMSIIRKEGERQRKLAEKWEKKELEKTLKGKEDYVIR